MSMGLFLKFFSQSKCIKVYGCFFLQQLFLLDTVFYAEIFPDGEMWNFAANQCDCCRLPSTVPVPWLQFCSNSLVRKRTWLYIPMHGLSPPRVWSMVPLYVDITICILTVYIWFLAYLRSPNEEILAWLSGWSTSGILTISCWCCLLLGTLLKTSPCNVVSNHSL